MEYQDLRDIVHHEHYDIKKYRSDKELTEFVWSKTVTGIRYG